MKSFGVRFYQGQVGAAGEDGTVSDLLLSLLDNHMKGELLPQTEEGRLKHELRELSATENGKVIKGVLALVRDDAPHIREADGGERPIELADHEGILEKNYFLLLR